MLVTWAMLPYTIRTMDVALPVSLPSAQLDTARSQVETGSASCKCLLRFAISADVPGSAHSRVEHYFESL